MPCKKKKLDHRKISVKLKENDVILNKPVRKKPPVISFSRSPIRSGKPTYLKDKRLPQGWTYFNNGKNATFFRDEKGKFIKNRRAAIGEMYERGDFSTEEISYVREGLQDEGWQFHNALPIKWMYKMYRHKIEGVDTEVLYQLAPNGSIYRSKAKIKKCFEELQLSTEDFEKLMEFKSDNFQDTKKLEEPDENWVFDKECCPLGWKMKKYTYNSRVSDKVEEVFHYLTPTNAILRGKKAIYQWMIQSGTFNHDDFNKFHFIKKEQQRREVQAQASLETKWSAWVTASDLPTGWDIRESCYLSQRKNQYRSPDQKLFSSRSRVNKFLKSGKLSGYSSSKSKTLSAAGSQESETSCTKWAEWRKDDIPCLPGWQFSIGRKRGKRVIRYRAIGGERVFRSRGPLIRYLNDHEGKNNYQLLALKKLLKANPVKNFEELRRNDKFIKNLEPDDNFFRFLKIRYDNHSSLAEEVDSRLPDGWRKKNINGVEYYKDPSGNNVFNSRKLVVDHLRRTSFEVSDDDLLDILHDSDEESELSESEEEYSDEELDEEVCEDIKPSKTHPTTFVDVQDCDGNENELFEDYQVDS